jgi:hypothetical protein
VPQQLAQLGFIVIQIGNRGGSPQRSQEYQGFSYYNLRDYALADKKGRHRAARVDSQVDRHRPRSASTATQAAASSPPRRCSSRRSMTFFKVGVSESGNHDNNVYNQNWSEQYHGLKVIAQGAGACGGCRPVARVADGQGNRQREMGREVARSGSPRCSKDRSRRRHDQRVPDQVPTTVDLARTSRAISARDGRHGHNVTRRTRFVW